jgi:hypothetical protein
LGGDRIRAAASALIQCIQRAPPFGENRLGARSVSGKLKKARHIAGLFLWPVLSRTRRRRERDGRGEKSGGAILALQIPLDWTGSCANRSFPRTLPIPVWAVVISLLPESPARCSLEFRGMRA